MVYIPLQLTKSQSAFNLVTRSPDYISGFKAAQTIDYTRVYYGLEPIYTPGYIMA